MLGQDAKQRVDYANKQHSQLSHNFTVFCEAARTENQALKQSGIKVDFKEKYLHAHFLDEELIFKYKPVLHNDSIKGSIIVAHREKELDHSLKITPVTEIYFDHLGNVLDGKEMKARDVTINEAYRLVIEAASKFLDSTYFKTLSYEDS